MLDQTQSRHLGAKFHLNMFIVSASGGQKPQFWANFDNWGGAPVPTPFTDNGQIWCAIDQTQGLHLHAEFHLNVLIVWAAGGQKPQIWATINLSVGVHGLRRPNHNNVDHIL